MAEGFDSSLQLPFPQGGVVLGLGADLVDVERIRNAHTRHGDRFLGRIFTDAEQAYCFGMKNPYPHLAARFAAKEAISKAFTTGIGKAFAWKSASIDKGSRGEPLVRLDAQGQALLDHVGGRDVLITLSHTAHQALAMAVLVK